MSLAKNPLYQKFASTMARLAPAPGGAIIIGLSGGLDSVCLFHFLLQFVRTHEWQHDQTQELTHELTHELTLIAHHQQHLIRGEESLADQRFVEELCRENGVRLYVSEDDVPALAKAQNLEDTARKVRHANWLLLADQLSLQFTDVKIATAHHADDQAETLLLHLERGTGLKGLGGMKEADGRYIRPLLGFTREELLACAAEEGWLWREDSTNQITDYRRNFLRNQVLPLWQSQADPGLTARIASGSRKIREVEELVGRLVDECVETLRVYPGEIFYPASLHYYSCRQFAKLDPALQPLVMRQLAANAGLMTDLEEVHTLDMVHLVPEGTGEKQLHLPHDYRFFRNRDYFWFEEERTDYASASASASVVASAAAASTASAQIPLANLAWANDLEIPLTLDSQGVANLPDSTWKVLVLTSSEDTGLPAALQGATFRTARTGDYFYNRNGRRVSLKDWFTAHAVPHHIRKHAWVLAKEQEILSSPLIHDESVNMALKAGTATDGARLMWYNSRK